MMIARLLMMILLLLPVSAAASETIDGGSPGPIRLFAPPAEPAGGGFSYGAPARLVEAGLRTAGDTLDGLPLIELPVDRPGRLMAVILSGDGGWRDLDRTIGGLLQEKGVPVVGIDSLRYFWRERTPDAVAAMLARVIDHYGDAWGTRKVVLIGYSFGADVLPFAANRLPPEERAHIGQVSLLGLAPAADFGIRVADWLGEGPGSGALPVRPELERIDPALVQCFYGRDEEDSLCPSPDLGPIERIGTAGGHHFDGNYEALARKILEGARRRLALPAS